MNGKPCGCSGTPLKIPATPDDTARKQVLARLSELRPPELQKRRQVFVPPSVAESSSTESHQEQLGSATFLSNVKIILPDGARISPL